MYASLMFMIDGAPRAFTPIRDIRAALDLPAHFGIALFEPKDFTGLGSIDSAGDALHTLRLAVVTAARQFHPDLLAAVDAVTAIFEAALRRSNAAVGLREPEIGFAVSGFSDVLRAWAYAVIGARAARQPRPPFEQVYTGWLMGTLRVSTTEYVYEDARRRWRVRVVTHAYGRFGLRIDLGDSGLIYAYDASLACPAEGFMTRLLAETAALLADASG